MLSVLEIAICVLLLFVGMNACCNGNMMLRQKSNDDRKRKSIMVSMIYPKANEASSDTVSVPTQF